MSRALGCFPAGRLLLGLALGPLAGLAAPTHRNVVYASVEGGDLTLDLYLPESSAGPAPLLVWIHGGGWRSGSKENVPAEVAALPGEGIAVASLNYRLTSQTAFPERQFPAPLHDVKGAVRFLRAHSLKYRLDPRRCGAWGSSAGAHLAALLATTGNAPELEGAVGGNLSWSSEVRVAIDYFGPSRLETMGGSHDLADSPESALLGFSLGEVKAHWDEPVSPWVERTARTRAAGPYHQVDAGDPPVFLAHGTADGTVPPSQSEDLAAALAEAGVEHVHRQVDGAGHTFGPMPTGEALAFLRQHLWAEPVDPLAAYARINPGPIRATPWGPMTTVDSPWVWHAEHGFLYLLPDHAEAVWAATAGGDWWRLDGLYPWIYSWRHGWLFDWPDDSGWLYAISEQRFLRLGE